MYDDAWYNAFVPRSSSPAPTQTSSNRQPQIQNQTHHQPHNHQNHKERRQSLLKMPNGDAGADDDANVEFRRGLMGDRAGVVAKGPPEATVTRRAKSFGDFYDVVRSYMKVEEEREDEVMSLVMDLEKKPKKRKKSSKEIESEIEFYDWYNGLEDKLVQAGNDEFVEYKEHLGLASRHLDALLQSTDATLEILASISGSFQTVKNQTNASRLQCKDLIEEKRRFLILEKDIAENLQYYMYLEPIARRLNAPGAGKFVRSREFSEMLANLDNCIDYMEKHPNHRESAVYRAKYKVLLTRALSLIRVHFTASLRDAAADISNRIADKQLNETTMSALLYAKFRTGASELKPVGMEIQERAVLGAGTEIRRETEYQSLMTELTQSYAAIRGKLILPLVTKRIGEIAIAPSTAKDLVAFARSSISYIRGICSDEFDLWYAWFATDTGLYDFLESICEKLHDHIRPRIVRETQLPKLCELCSLIQARYMDDTDDDDTETDRESEDGDAYGQRIASSTGSLDFTLLVQPVMEDAQTRLVFIAMSVMRNEIELYKPQPEDLRYPPKDTPSSAFGFVGRNSKAAPVLSGRKNPVKGAEGGGAGSSNNKSDINANENDDMKENGAQDWSFNASEAAREHWYPTLAKAVWLLSRIYRLINSTVFDDLAHQIVHQTTVSLHKAASHISTRASPTDAQLFLIKHLLILKEHIVAFDIEHTNDIPTSSLSFDPLNTTSNSFWDMFQRDRNSGGSLFNPVNLVQYLGSSLFLPSAVSNMIDAKSELDGRLRTAINEFVAGFVARMTSEIGTVSDASATNTGNNTTTSASNTGIKSPSDALNAQNTNKEQQPQQPQPQPPKKKKVPLPKAISSLANTRNAITHNVPHLKKKLSEYIENSRTRNTLLAAVLEGVLSKVEEFYGANVQSNAGDGASTRNADEKTLWSLDRYVKWCVSVFGVERVGGERAGADDDDDGDDGDYEEDGKSRRSASANASAKRSVSASMESESGESSEDEDEEEE